MNDHRFDEFVRDIGATTSRRSVLKGLIVGATGGILAAFGVSGEAAASGGQTSTQSQRSPFGFPWPFGGSDHERPPACCPESAPRLCGTQCVDFHTDPDNCGGCGVVCPDDNNPCTNRACVRGTCQQVAVPTNGPCDDGNPCTTNTVCDANGVCAGSTVATGTVCDDGNPCTTNSVCDANGVCGGGTPVDCPTNTSCTTYSCDPVSGCISTPTTDPNPSNNPCQVRICDPVEGWVTTYAGVGTACDDNNACTANDMCDGSGNCVGTPITCPPPDQCHTAGVCEAGACTNPIVDDGTACDDGNPCTINDSCTNGVCVGTPVTCPPLDQCHTAGVCEAGTCTNPIVADGTKCDDGNPCTVNDMCTNGVCAGTAVTCPSGQTCDPSTGVCV